MSELVRYHTPLRLPERWLCLELCNRTVDWHASEQPTERLHGYRDLLAWGLEVGLLSGRLQARLLELAAAHTAKARQALSRLRELREVCYRIFAAAARHRAPAAADIAGLNRFLARALSSAAVSATRAGFVWAWQRQPDLDWALWPVARSAADLLTSDELTRVGQCADDRGCGWLFVDSARGAPRRWCSMKACGNRAKQRRHISREKLAQVARP